MSDALGDTIWRWGLARDLSGFSAQRVVDFGAKAAMIAANHTEADELADHILSEWPCDWADRSIFADHFMKACEAGRLLLRPSRGLAFDLLKARWPLRQDARLNMAEGKKATPHFRSTAAVKRLDKLPQKERLDEYDAQRRFSPGRKIDITVIEGGKRA